MRRLQGWRQVCRGWKLHIDSYTGPGDHWQLNLRTEIQELWQSLYRRAIALVQNEVIEPVNLGPHAELTLLTCDLGKALKRFGFSRALVGGVALIISILTRPNDQFRLTLGPHAPYVGRLPHARTQCAPITSRRGTVAPWTGTDTLALQQNGTP